MELGSGAFMTQPSGEWLAARREQQCGRCSALILRRQRYFASVSRISYCAWCASEVWGIKPPKKEKV
jgi:hypothetical protein